MKQHITVKQLNELSRKARRKLRQVVVKKWGAESDFDLLLSIGQMIELLEENYDSLAIENYSHRDGWHICDFANATEKECVRMTEGKELCNCLWKATKEIVEK